MTYSSSESENECENNLSSTAAVFSGVSYDCSDDDGVKRQKVTALLSHAINSTCEPVSVISSVDNAYSVTGIMTARLAESAAQEVFDTVEKLNSSVAESSVTSVVQDFFNLSERVNVSAADSFSAVEQLHAFQEQPDAHTESTVDFWNTDVLAEDWSHPERIWGTASDSTENGTGHVSSEIANSVPDSVVPKIKGYSSKRHQSEISTELSPSTELSSALKKSCFMVHHKIAPQLHTVGQRINRIPGKVLQILPGHSGTVNGIHWGIPEYSHLLLTASMDATVRVWNVFSSGESDPCVRTVKVHNKAVKAARWSACCRQILSCSYDKSAKLTDVESGTVFSAVWFLLYCLCFLFRIVTEVNSLCRCFIFTCISSGLD